METEIKPSKSGQLTVKRAESEQEESVENIPRELSSKLIKSDAKLSRISKMGVNEALFDSNSAIEEVDVKATSSINIEKYLEETIYDYLRSQKDIPEHDFENIDEYEISSEQLRHRKEDEAFILDTVEKVLADILENVENTRLFKHKYEEIQKDHPQYPLFDIRCILPDFKINRDMIRKLSFRETLVISNTDDISEHDGVPRPVGAMCIHIHFGEGLAMPKPQTEKEIEQSIEESVERVRKESRPFWEGRRANSKTEMLEKKLKNYEEFLEHQIAGEVDKFLIHLSADFDVEGRNGGSRLVSWVDRELHTLEERRTEYLAGYNEHDSSKQVLYFSMQPTTYYVKHCEKLPEKSESNETRKYISKLRCKNLVGEGANFVLMRYLAVMKFVGTFELATIYIDGSLCRNIYECTPLYEGIVNNQSTELVKIYRSIIEENGIQHQCVTVLSTYGKIITQEWEGCPYIFHVNPLSLSPAKPMFYDTLAMKKLWQADMELMSKYLDCKTEAELKMKAYLKDHPEVQNLMGDYIQSILLLKPENIMPFTQEFFLGFEPYKLPSLPYFEEGQDKHEDETDMFW